MSKPPADTPDAGDMPEVALRVISNLYETVADGAPYEPMFFAMDEVIEQLLTDPHDSKTTNRWSPMFAPHFHRAAHVFDIMSRKETATPLSFVDQRHAPTAVVDPEGRLVATNMGFDAIMTEPRVDGLSSLFATPADRTRFATLAKANRPDAQAILNLVLPGKDQPQSFLAGQTGQLEYENGAGPSLYLTLIQPRWTEKTGELLKQAFGLTGAEVDTMRLFLECGSIKGVAARRRRSIRTVRTQLSRVFAQMGISGQTELALFLATLSGMEPVNATLSNGPVAEAPRSDRVVARKFALAGHAVEVYEYGAPKGHPVLLLQSSHPPELTVGLRRALFSAGVRIIAPLKPGSGNSVSINGIPGPEDMTPLYAELVDQLKLDKVIVAGQASGGLYALSFATAYPARTHAVALIDTGLPFADRAEMMQLHTSIRRTLVPARYIPELLYLPHKLVAANFQRSARGEESVVDYFFNGSPHDQALTRTHRWAYDVTRRIISYSFDDTTRLVQDVTRWANDWTPTLSAVAAEHRLRFIHGAQNTMFKADKITRFVEPYPNVDHRILLGGQLAIFEQPETFSTALRELGSSM